MTATMPTHSDNRALIGRDEINDLDEILAITNTDRDETIHHVQNHADTIYTWNYDKGERPALNKLYEKAKNAQWNGETDLPWDTDVDPEKVIAENAIANAGVASDASSMRALGGPFAKLSDEDYLRFGIESNIWTLSQFLHGEQGALVCTAKIVETVPWIDA